MESFEKIINLIAKPRLERYCPSTNTAFTLECLSRYILNIKRAETFYFALHMLEVSLRNAIYNSFQKHFEIPFFYLHEVDSRQHYYKRKEFHSRECWKMICGAKHHLEKRGESTHDGKLIAELNFGFWTKLFLDNHRKYTEMWRIIFNEVFPNKQYSGGIDQVKNEVGLQIDEIRKIRNRIFHYEPILDFDIDLIHQKIFEIVQWIDIDLYRLLETFNSYKEFSLSEKEIIDILKRDFMEGKNDEAKAFGGL